MSGEREGVRPSLSYGRTVRVLTPREIAERERQLRNRKRRPDAGSAVADKPDAPKPLIPGEMADAD